MRTFFRDENWIQGGKQAEHKVFRKGILNQLFLPIFANIKQNYKFREKKSFSTDTDLRSAAVRLLYHHWLFTKSVHKIIILYTQQCKGDVRGVLDFHIRWRYQINAPANFLPRNNPGCPTVCFEVVSMLKIPDSASTGTQTPDFKGSTWVHRK
jgi:hypothetical protein